MLIRLAGTIGNNANKTNLIYYFMETTNVKNAASVKSQISSENVKSRKQAIEMLSTLTSERRKYTDDEKKEVKTGHEYFKTACNSPSKAAKILFRFSMMENDTVKKVLLNRLNLPADANEAEFLKSCIAEYKRCTPFQSADGKALNKKSLKSEIFEDLKIVYFVERAKFTPELLYNTITKVTVKSQKVNDEYYIGVDNAEKRLKAAESKERARITRETKKEAKKEASTAA